MRQIKVEPLPPDKVVARLVERNTTQAIERISRVLTWAADEHLLYALSAGLWVASRYGHSGRRQVAADHILASVVVANLLPHLLKNVVNQRRPDRCMVHGPRHGIPRSGKANDAFPSGHAMHAGALASAVSWLYPNYKGLAWTVAGAVAATRVIVLAHWLSDVAVGFAVGVAIERLARPLTRARLRWRARRLARQGRSPLPESPPHGRHRPRRIAAGLGRVFG